VIEAVILDYIPQRAAGTRFGIVGTKNDPIDPRQNQSAGTHGTRFEGDVQIRSCQTLRSRKGGGLADGLHLGVGGWILPPFYSVSGRADHDSVHDDDSADGNFVPTPGLLSQLEGFAHAKFVKLPCGVPSWACGVPSWG